MVAAAQVYKDPSVGRDNKLPQLLDSAAGHFRTEGYAAASMRDIAARAGMKAGSMYYYFASKEDLLVVVHEEGIRRITDAVSSALLDTLDPWQRLQAAMSAHLDALLDGGDYAQVVVRELPRGDAAARRRLIALRDEYEFIFHRLVDELPLAPDAPRRHLRLMLLGAMNWTQNWYRPEGDSPRDIAEAFVDLIRKGENI